MDMSKLPEDEKLHNRKVTVIPIVVGILELIFKHLEKRQEKLEIRGRDRLTVIIKSEYLHWLWKPGETYYHSNLKSYELKIL